MGKIILTLEVLNTDNLTELQDTAIELCEHIQGTFNDNGTINPLVSIKVREK